MIRWFALIGVLKEVQNDKLCACPGASVTCLLLTELKKDDTGPCRRLKEQKAR